jgi:AraC-like DNA-binding protein
MVCSRCKMVVKAELEKAGLHPLSIELGEVEVTGEPDAATIKNLDNSLKQLGFEIIDDRKSRIIEQIKTAVISLVHYNKEQHNLNLSSYLSQQLNYDYGHLSNLFSEVEGSTIEKYFIAQKIEKVKELIMYNELNLSQIANQLGYSSVAHLSAQFKKQTGLTPTFYRSLKKNARRNIEEL